MFNACLPRRGRNTNQKNLNTRFFRYDTLRIATNNFSTILGYGGYGSVYKGVHPDDGRTVAVKKFSRQYDGFLEMVGLMSRLRHVNLIQVIGCCIDNIGQQFLVCEYAENGSVWEHLHNRVSTPALSWETRAALCIGTARGLSYLHEEIDPGIIHRDIKPSNIVLDANFVPKIVDFDLIQVVDGTSLDGSIEFSDIGVEYWTSYTTQYCKGTLGYLDPNYIVSGQLTEKVDVYSFGLVMLEIITGRRPIDMTLPEIDDQQILDWVTRVLKDGAVLKLVDPKLTDFPSEDVERFIDVALLCTQATPEQRPRMSQVVNMLSGSHKSNLEISEMVNRLIADQPHQWGTSVYCVPAPVSGCSLTISLDGRGSSTPILGTDYAAEMESREEAAGETGSCRGNSDSFIVLNRTDVSHNELARSSQEDQSRPEDVVRAYFERSMEKIMRYQVAKRRSNRTTKSSSRNMFKEAVYPPFLTGEYRSSRVLYSGCPPPL